MYHGVPLACAIALCETLISSQLPNSVESFSCCLTMAGLHLLPLVLLAHGNPTRHGWPSDVSVLPGLATEELDYRRTHVGHVEELLYTTQVFLFTYFDLFDCYIQSYVMR